MIHAKEMPKNRRLLDDAFRDAFFPSHPIWGSNGFNMFQCGSSCSLTRSETMLEHLMPRNLKQAPVQNSPFALTSQSLLDKNIARLPNSRAFTRALAFLCVRIRGCSVLFQPSHKFQPNSASRSLFEQFTAPT